MKESQIYFLASVFWLTVAAGCYLCGYPQKAAIIAMWSTVLAWHANTKK